MGGRGGSSLWDLCRSGPVFAARRRATTDPDGGPCLGAGRRRGGAGEALRRAPQGTRLTGSAAASKRPSRDAAAPPKRSRASAPGSPRSCSNLRRAPGRQRGACRRRSGGPRVPAELDA